MGIELVTTDGIFALDGGEWQVTNNIWIVGDDREVIVFDAAHDAAARSAESTASMQSCSVAIANWASSEPSEGSMTGNDLPSPPARHVPLMYRSER